MGGDWAADDTIYFVPSNTAGIWKVSASGGTPEEVTKLDRSKGEVGHRWPQALPGGKGLLFTVWVGPGWDEKSLHLHVFGTGERRVLAQGASSGRYVSSGYLVYNRDGAQNLMALPFDLARLEVTGGPAVTLAEQVWEGGAEGAQFAVSDAGTMAYVPSHRIDTNDVSRGSIATARSNRCRRRRGRTTIRESHPMVSKSP
jgi:serine/threonine-protein kinase